MDVNMTTAFKKLTESSSEYPVHEDHEKTSNLELVAFMSLVSSI